MERQALAIARNAAAAMAVEQPRSLTGPAGAQVLVLLNRTGEELAALRGPHGQSWPDLTAVWTLRTIPGESRYSVPGGFSNVIQGTEWDDSRDWRVPGPVSPQDWQRMATSQTGGLSIRWRMAAQNGARVIELQPTPESAFDLSLQYISGFWVRDRIGGPPVRDSADADTHVPAFPADIMELGVEWRLRKALGLAFSSELAEYELRRDRQFAALSPSGAVTLGGGSEPLLTIPKLPDRGWVA